jgi:hypothetical protein
MSEQILAFPLQWPLGWKRTDRPGRSAFKNDKTVHSATTELMHELRRMRADDIVLSTNIPVRNDGLPYSGYKAPGDKGVAVYFKLKKVPHVMACDKWEKIEHNIYAIAKHIEALRGQERWGVGSLEQAFSGFKALPPSAADTQYSPGTWWSVLEINKSGGTYRITEEEVLSAYKMLARKHHPDMPGGSHEKMQELNQAKEEAIAYAQQFK